MTQCKYQPNVQCSDADCEHCAWEPGEDKLRRLLLKEQFRQGRKSLILKQRKAKK